MALKTLIIDNVADVTPVLSNGDNLEAVITVCTAINKTTDAVTFQLLLGTSIEDRRIIYEGTIGGTSTLKMTDKFSIPSGHTLYMSMGGNDGYAVFSFYQQLIDLVAADELVDDKLQEVRSLHDETRSYKDTVVDKEAAISVHYDAMDIVKANITAITNANNLIVDQLTNYKGDYDTNTTYSVGDAVSYNGSIYLSKADDNTGNDPDANNSDYWLALTKTNSSAVNIAVSNIDGLDANNVQDALSEHQGDIDTLNNQVTDSSTDISNLQAIIPYVDTDNKDIGDYIKLKDKDDGTVYKMYIYNGEIRIETV